MLSNVLDWLYPPKCMICNKIIPLGKTKWVCNVCISLLEPIGKEVCAKCGIPWDKAPRPCPDCQAKNFSFGWNRSPFIYDDIIQQLIYRFKYGQHPEYGSGFASLICKFLGDWPFMWADVLIPVPLHRTREKERGYNQALLLAKGISKQTGVPVRADILTRVKHTQPLSGLSPKARVQNLKSAFEINKRIDAKFNKILLIDDIFTTGSTAQTCTKLLKENGNHEVSCVTFAIVQKKKSIHCAGKVV